MCKVKSELAKGISKVAGYSAENWLPVAKVAELCNVKPQSIREAIKERMGSYRGGAYVFRTGSGKGGGQYEILLTSLPEPAQHKYWLEHIQALPEPPETALVAAAQPEATILDHATYALIHDAFTRKAASIQEEARRRAEILDKYLELMASGLRAYFSSPAARHVMTPRTRCSIAR